MQPAPKHSWFKSGLRFCGSCLVTLCCWALWIVLGALFVMLCYIAVARELPVPGYVLRRIEAEMAQSGLVLSFGRARLDPTGQVLLEDVRLRATQFEDPLLTCRVLYVRHDIWSLLAGWTSPEEIQVEGAALHLPAMLAPSGTTEAVVRDLAATLRHRDKIWRIEQFAGHLGPLAVTLHGEFTPPRVRHAAEGTDLSQLTGHFLQFARRLAPLTERLEAFDEPALQVRLDTDINGINRATVLLTAAGATRPWNQPLVAGPFAAGTQFVLDGRTAAQTVRIHAAFRHVTGPADVAATGLRLQLQAQITPGALTARAGEAQLAATEVSTPEGDIVAPVVRADLAGWPKLRLETSAAIEGEILAAQVEASLEEKSARIHASGRARHELITRALEKHMPRAAPYFRFNDPVTFDAEAVLAPGWRFDRVAATVSAGRLDSRGVAITSARGRIDIVGRSFLASDARLTTANSAARGSYWMDFGTSDYRMLLDGRLQPLDINGWFRGDWWAGFWNRWFAFAPDAPPSAEVDVQGRWKDPTLSNNFIRAHVTRATIWGGDFDSVDATLFVRPVFAHGIAVSGRRGGGTQFLTGSFKRLGIPGSRDTARFEFDFDTNAEPAVLGRMLEGRADSVLSSLRFTAAPRVHAWGALNGEGPVLVPDYRFDASVAQSLWYYGFPLESARVTGGVRGPEVRLEGITFGAAGGTGGGVALLNGPADARRLSFDLHLGKARLGDTVHAVQEYDAARTGKPVPTGPDSKFVRTASNSQLDVSLSAIGDPANLDSFTGVGQAALTGGELGEVHLFGLLSQVLSGLSLNFSSLKFDAAHTRFQVAHSELYFPDLKVTGPTAAIDAQGKYSFNSGNLDFNARFKPYEQTNNLLTAAVSLVINPLTSILALKLNGPLGDPKWSFEVSPGSKPAAPAPAPAAPPAVTAPPPTQTPGPGG